MERAARLRFSIGEKTDLGVIALLLAGGLALAGCGGNSGTESESRTLIFDDLGGGSPIVQVYPGVTESTADKKSNGTFNDGEGVYAQCKTTGRTIQSDTDVGEKDRTSNEWILVHGSPGKTQFATAVYVENPDALLNQLPNC